MGLRHPIVVVVPLCCMTWLGYMWTRYLQLRESHKFWRTGTPPVWRGAFTCLTYLIRIRGVTHSYLWHYLFVSVTLLVCVIKLIYTGDMTGAGGSRARWKRISYCSMLPLWCDAFTCVTWLIHMCDMTHLYVWHDSFTCEIWLIHVCDMTHSYVWYDSFTHHASHSNLTWLIHMCDMTHSYTWHDTFTCETWLIHTFYIFHTCELSHWTVLHDSVICMTWLIHTCGMTHSYMAHSYGWHFSYVWNDSLNCMTWLSDVFDMTHWTVWHDSVMYLIWLPQALEWRDEKHILCRSILLLWHDTFTRVTWLIPLCDMTYSYVWHDLFTCVTWHAQAVQRRDESNPLSQHASLMHAYLPLSSRCRCVGYVWLICVT